VAAASFLFALSVEVAMRRIVGMLALAVVSTQACVRLHGGGSMPEKSVISREDIERVHALTALDAVQRYRADILVTKAQSSIYLNKQTHPVVFLDSQFLGQVDELRNIGADGIGEIRLYGGTDATRLFGAQYGGGVIQIMSRGG
jgi:hypothetical protein